TLNVIVLAMTFTLFPIYMGVVKTIVTVATIFVLIPLLVKTCRIEQPAPNERQELTRGRLFFAGSPPIPNLLAGFADLAYYSGQICLRTLPFMIVAGFVGAAIAQLIPLEQLENVSPLIGIPLVTAVAILLPTPMAFDVMLTHALYAHGLPASYSLILLSLL